MERFGLGTVRKPLNGDNSDETALSGAKKEAPPVDAGGLSIEAKALHAVKCAPDIRQDKVDALKKAIAEGSYSVSSRELARHLLDADAI